MGQSSLSAILNSVKECPVQALRSSASSAGGDQIWSAVIRQDVSVNVSRPTRRLYVKPNLAQVLVVFAREVKLWSRRGQVLRYAVYTGIGGVLWPESLILSMTVRRPAGPCMWAHSCSRTMHVGLSPQCSAGVLRSGRSWRKTESYFEKTRQRRKQTRQSQKEM